MRPASGPALTCYLLKRGQGSEFDWMNIKSGQDLVGKVRGLVKGNCLIINSIYIFSEFEGKGYGARVVDRFKSEYDTIIADRVRPSARGFWRKMGFTDRDDGNCVWNRRKEVSDGNG